MIRLKTNIKSVVTNKGKTISSKFCQNTWWHQMLEDVCFVCAYKNASMFIFLPFA